MRRGPTYIGGFAGSLAGSLIPGLWGDGQMSPASLLFFLLGGIAGVLIAYRLSA